MAQQEEGWPLGLQPLNERLGLARNPDYSGSISFNTSLTGSPTSSADSSSDLDTQVSDSVVTRASLVMFCLDLVQFRWSCIGNHLRCQHTEQHCCWMLLQHIDSTGSFFHDNSITLGRLIGVSSILELSKRSVKGRKTEAPREKRCSNNRSKVWLFSLCSRDSTDGENVEANNVPSLGHFLAVERRVANRRNNQNPTTTIYGPDEFALATPNLEPNLLFVNGSIAPPRTSPSHGAADDDNHGVPVLFSCMCGHPPL